MVLFVPLQSLSINGGYVGSGRYYIFLLPGVAYLFAVAGTRPWFRASLVMLMLAGSVTTVSRLRATANAPGSMGELQLALEQANVGHVYADYWVAYRLAWLSEERIIASPSIVDRYPEWTDLVRAADRVAYVLYLPLGPDRASAQQLICGLEAMGVPFVQQLVGEYLVVVPERNVPFETLRNGCA